MDKGETMEYSIYKLKFRTGVHFGEGMLNESAYTFKADQLFSGLYIEALKLGREKELYDAVKSGKLLFSDAFPYKEEKYFVPKPMVYVESGKKGESKQKKAYKKMKYLPVECLDSFLNGTMDVEKVGDYDFGQFCQQTMACVRDEEETRPYRVGTFYFDDGCGLYVIAGYTSAVEKELAEDLMESLSYTGIGGKKAIGLGKFELLNGRSSQELSERLQKDGSRYMLLSVGLPIDEELEQVLDGASYQLLKRSGFVASEEYAAHWSRKRDLYVLAAGSCVNKRFSGDIYDVADGGRHAVYRYAKPLFMEV